MARGDTPATQHGVGDPPREPCATSPSPTPPAIPLDAVVEVEGRVWTRTEDGWDDGHEFEYATWPVGRTLTALYHARREREEARERIAELEEAKEYWIEQSHVIAQEASGAAATAAEFKREREEARNDAAAQMMANVALANRGDDAIRERDEARSIADRYAAHVKSLERERNDAERERDAARDGFRLRGDTIEGLRRDLADARKARDHFRTEYHQGSVALDAICRMIETEDGYSACQTAVENVREVVNRLAVYAFEREAERDAAREERDNATELRDELRRTLHRVAKRVGVTVPLDHWHHDSVESAIGNMVEALEAERDAARRELAEFRSLASDASDTRARLDAQVSINGALRAKDLQWLQLAEMGRELAAVQDQGLGATARTSREAPNSEESDCGSAVASPAPVSAPLSETAPLSGAGNTGETGKPRRWWMVVDRHGDSCGTCLDEDGALDLAAYLERYAAGGPHIVVPLVEARVTRETVERVAQVWGAQWPECYGSLEDMTVQQRARYVSNARAALSALGLTVEGDDNG